MLNKQKNLFGEFEDPKIVAALYSRAIRLRLTHDKGGVRLKSGEYDIKDVVKALEYGVNFFTQEKIELPLIT